MERFCDIFSHPHELIIHRGWGRALRHKMADGLRGIAQTGREHCRGALDKVFRGERLSLSQLCHDISEEEGEVVQVLLGRSGSQEGTELAS